MNQVNHYPELFGLNLFLKPKNSNYPLGKNLKFPLTVINFSLSEKLPLYQNNNRTYCKEKLNSTIIKSFYNKSIL